jgi:hypothetical protein
LCRRN